MNCTYNPKIAVKLGVNSALAAGFLFSETDKNSIYRDKSYWVRCSGKMLSAAFPHMGKKAAAGALNRLVDEGIFIRRPYNQKTFDSTYFYSFTEYGSELMKETEVSNKFRNLFV